MGADLIDILSRTMLVVAAALAIVLVRELTRRQRLLRESWPPGTPGQKGP